jgi:hypothetical protein
LWAAHSGFGCFGRKLAIDLCRDRVETFCDPWPVPWTAQVAGTSAARAQTSDIVDAAVEPTG